MTPRALRRAQERQAKKLALKATGKPGTGSADPSHTILANATEPPTASGSGACPEAFRSEARDCDDRQISPAQIAANKLNAQKSTGPTSDTGKAKSSLNAVKTGLTGRTVLLPGDDAARYQAHVAHFVQQLAPVGENEQNLVQSLADTEWRLLRIPALEMGIYAVGRLELAAEFPNEDPEVRQQLIEAKVFLAYQRQLNNLSIQEGRLRRQREKDSASLKQLQDERKRKEKKRLNEAAYDYIDAVLDDTYQDWEPQKFGFEFSMEQVEVRAMQIKPDLFAEYEKELAASRKNRTPKAA